MSSHRRTHAPYGVPLLVVLFLTIGCGEQPTEDPVLAERSLQGNCTVSVTGSPPAGSMAGGPTVNLTATASCQSGVPEYHFTIQKPDGAWEVLRSYEAGGSLAWSTAGLLSGLYKVLVKVRAQGSTDAWEGYDFSNRYTITGNQNSCSSAIITSDPLSTAMAGTSVSFTASASCPIGSTPEYKFIVRDPMGTHRTLRAYGTGTSHAWNTNGWLDGVYSLQVYARQ
jgi:hypothetical protein